MRITAEGTEGSGGNGELEAALRSLRNSGRAFVAKSAPQNGSCGFSSGAERAREGVYFGGVGNRGGVAVLRRS